MGADPKPSAELSAPIGNVFSEGTGVSAPEWSKAALRNIHCNLNQIVREQPGPEAAAGAARRARGCRSSDPAPGSLRGTSPGAGTF